MEKGLNESEISPNDDVPRYKIGTVASLLGVTPNLLRAWERRYAFTRPARQTGRQRLYSERDLALLGRVVELIHQGLSVGEVAALGVENLEPPERPDKDGNFPLPVAYQRASGRTFETPLAAWIPELPARRSSGRYAGEGLDVRLEELNAEQSATVHRLYQILKGLYELWTYMEYQPAERLVARRLVQLQDPRLVDEIEKLQRASHAGESLLLVASLHDASHGALSLMVEDLATRDLKSASGKSLALLISLARDQAKILRNAFVDLDPGLREADEQLKAHGAVPIMAKIGHLEEAGWVDRVVANFSGFLTCRCLETSCLDRLLYRCLAWYGRRPGLHLWVTQEANDWVRWSFQAPAQGAEPKHDPFSVYLMSKVAGRTPRSTLAKGFLGARRQDGTDWLWFHWPVYLPPPDIPRCLCHPLS